MFVALRLLRALRSVAGTFPDTQQPAGAACVPTEVRRMLDTDAEPGLKALRLIIVWICWLRPLTQLFSSSEVSD